MVWLVGCKQSCHKNVKFQDLVSILVHTVVSLLCFYPLIFLPVSLLQLLIWMDGTPPEICNIWFTDHDKVRAADLFHIHIIDLVFDLVQNRCVL